MWANDDVVRQFRQTFRLDELTIHEGQAWIVSVRPGQITLGSMVVSSSHGHLDFQGFSTDDSTGLSAAFATAERLAKIELGAVRVNLACLMMKDPVVHFHVLPRYSQPVERYDRTWLDEDWPGPPTIGAASTADDVLGQLVRDLSAAL